MQDLVLLRKMCVALHDVEGDGNCGCCCLLLALAALGILPCPEDQEALRADLLLVRCAWIRDDVFGLLQHQEHEHNEKRRLWNEGLENVFNKGTPCSNCAFMEEVGVDGHFANFDHWMDSMFVVPLFCLRHRVRVVVCRFHFITVTKWQTDIYDARTGKIVEEHREGLHGGYGGDKSFGLHYDGQHYQHLIL
jgi:hypothetical protein